MFLFIYCGKLINVRVVPLNFPLHLLRNVVKMYFKSESPQRDRHHDPLREEMHTKTVRNPEGTSLLHLIFDIIAA